MTFMVKASDLTLKAFADRVAAARNKSEPTPEFLEALAKVGASMWIANKDSAALQSQARGALAHAAAERVEEPPRLSEPRNRHERRAEAARSKR